MKKYFLAFIVLSSVNAFAQNEIKTPVGQPLKVGLINVTSGRIQLNNTQFLKSSGTGNIFLGEQSGNAITTGVYNTFFGFESGLSTTAGKNNTFLGLSAGRSSTGDGNSFFGSGAGYSTTTGNFNTFIGQAAGYHNLTGAQNISIGYASGSLLSNGAMNVFIGNSAGNENSTGKWNTYLGHASTNSNTTGERNTNIGAYSGAANILGSGNVFIGYRAGYNTLASNTLYIANTDTPTPLIWGSFLNNQVVLNAKTGISTSTFPSSVTSSTGLQNTSTYQLFVKGGVLTEKLIVVSGWADYVFEKDYKLLPLSEVEKFICINGRLPNVPSASEIEKKGMDIGSLTRIKQEKIEELTLHLIQMEKRLVQQDNELEELTTILNNSSINKGYVYH